MLTTRVRRTELCVYTLNSLSMMIRQASLFLASPSDCGAERDIVRQVVDDLNNSTGRLHGLRVEVIGWDSHARPATGNDSQALINEQIAGMSQHLLFVSILWNRFGRPTPRATSGTQEEYNLAMEERERREDEELEQLEVMIYFNEAPSNLNYQEELIQKSLVLEFKKNLKKSFYWTFNGTAEFERMFRGHYSDWLSETIKKRPKQSELTQNQSFDLARLHTRRVLRELNCVGSRLTPDQRLENVSLAAVYCERNLSLIPSQRVPSNSRTSGYAASDTLPSSINESEVLLQLCSIADGYNLETVAPGQWFSLVGEAGYGKSSLLHQLCSSLLTKQEQRAEVLFLQARDFPIRNMEATELQVAPGLNLNASAFLPDWSLSNSLRDVLEALNTSEKPLIIVLDTLDFLVGRLEVETVKAFLQGLRERCCALVTTCRPKEHEDLCRRTRLPEQTFLLAPFGSETRELVIQRHVDVFYASKSEKYRSRQKNQLIALSQNSRFTRIFSNPLLTRMTFEVFAPGHIPEELDTRRIYDAYWNAKVDHEATRFKVSSSHLQAQTQSGKVELTLALAQQMLRMGQPLVEGETTAILKKKLDDQYGVGVGTIAQNDLVSENVLLPSATLRPVEFFHQTFFEYAAARYVANDRSLNRLEKLRDHLREHQDSVRLPILSQSVLLLAEPPLPSIIVVGDGQLSNTSVPLITLLESLWRHEQLVETGFEVVAKSSAIAITTEIVERIESQVRDDADARRKFRLSLRLFDDQKLHTFESLLTRLFANASPEEKEQWMEPLSFLSSDYPEAVSVLLLSWKDYFSAETLRHNHVGHYLREIYTRLAEHAPKEALLALREWLAHPSLPSEGRRFLVGALQPCTTKYGKEVLELLYDQAEFVQKIEHRELLALIAAKCPAAAFTSVFSTYLSVLDSNESNQAMLAVMMLAQAPPSVLRAHLKKVTKLFVESDLSRFHQMEPLFVQYCRVLPIEWWNDINPEDFHIGKNLAPRIGAALRLMVVSKQTTSAWQDWLWAGLEDARIIGERTRSNQKLALHLAALGVLWCEDWRKVLNQITSCLKEASEAEIRGALGACNVTPKDDEQAREVLALLLRAVRKSNERQTHGQIMGVASKLCSGWPQHGQQVGESLIFYIRSEHSNLGEAGKRLVPLAEMIEELSQTQPTQAIALAEQIGDLPQANLRRACANAYQALAPHEPLIAVEWLAHQSELDNVICDIAASIVVAALNATTDAEISDSNTPLYQHIVSIIPRLGERSNECGVKMTWACVRLAQRNHALEAWHLLTQFMDSLGTRGVFCIRDAVDAIVTAGGDSTLPFIATRLKGAPHKIQVAIIQGLAKSPSRRFLRNIHDQADLNLSDEVRNMLAYLIRKHEVVVYSKSIEVEL